ncbi:helix-turn-helix transcriptional regulator [Dictyobacter arantiisoli]|uniref:Transcriptional regulator n=1 Tax=Dictyobacter arantiisoli TaxID=2014874 RepID=A0A5A5TL84_9CHLR|nr:YafY family protein [Dictyobacter arantiisoli]GCF12038.1 transcriptional regulator [Dictyobacter arantiisoli]
MYFPTTRVLTVLELLQSRQKMSGQELAERLEVDPRTVRRYITMLQDLGIPVEGTRGRYGYYHLRPGYKLPPLMFNDDEALALTLSLLVGRKLGLDLATPAVEGVLAKIERVLPQSLRERVQAVQDALIIDVMPAHTIPRSEMVLLLSQAILQCQRVHMRYRAYGARETERDLDPYGLVYREGYWYLVGFCLLRQEPRTFRLDRLLDVAPGEATFKRPEHFDCLAFVQQSISQTPGAWYIEVLLEATLEEAQRFVSPTLALLEPEAHGVSFKCYTDRLDWIARMLVSFGCNFIIRQPLELRTELRQLSQRLISLAEQEES